MSSIPQYHGTNAPCPQYAMAVLLPDVEEAQRVAAALDEVRRPEGPLAVIAVPPVRGLAFFADVDRQEKLDRWWSHAIPRDSQPVYLLRHQPGVVPWLTGLDGRFIVGAASPAEAEVYAAAANVTLARGEAAVDVAVTAAEIFAGSGVFRDDAVGRLQSRLGRSPARPQPRFRRARLRAADEVFLAGTPASPGAHPIPNLPPAESDAQSASPAATGPAEEPGREDLVRALAETLHRLQKIRSGA